MEFSFLEDEKFDFDLPLSPEEERNGEEDDDEIFFGPIGHKERCVATNTATKATKILVDFEKAKPASSLNPDQVDEIFKEATSMAFMLKTSCSSDVNLDSEDLDSEDRIRKNNYPELINDITNKILCAPRDSEQENASETQEIEKSRVNVMDTEEGQDGFVVRRRVLRERNHVGGDVGTSKLQRLMQKSKAPSQKSPLRVNKQVADIKAQVSPCSLNKGLKESRRKTIAVTPNRNSFSSSKAERNKSSSTSDTSFSEETKQSKLPTASQCGFKPPVYTSGRRRRSSSNSSVSSTSSTSSISAFNPNDTLTLPKPSEAQPKTLNIKQPSGTKSKPSTKAMLTKAFTSKPVFARPNEVTKTSKLQPMKVVQFGAASRRSISSTGVNSPALFKKTTTRSASAGTTPLSSQTTQINRTPAKGSTPVCQRSANVSSSSTAAKPKQSSLARTGAVSGKAVTPLQRRSSLARTSEVSGKAVTPLQGRNSLARTGEVSGKAVTPLQRRSSLARTGEVSGKAVTPLQRSSFSRIPSFGKGKNNSASGVVARRPTSAMKVSLEHQGDKKKIQIPPTPENKTTKAKGTPNKNAETPEHKKKPPSSANRRTSLLPTPNLNKKSENKKSQSSSPVPFHLSPEDSTSTIQKFKAAVKKLDMNLGSENNAACSSSDNISLDNSTEQPLSDSLEIKPITPSPDKKNLDVTGVEVDDSPDLMIQASPAVQMVLVDVSVDPFSPGIDSPDLPIDGCLDPIVVSTESKDLIDLSYVSPKSEVDLIDLTAKSPLVEARLVDF